MPAQTETLQSQRARVAELLGREPTGAYQVVVTTADGDPVVLRNAPFLDNGRPMPTRYWLLSRLLNRLVGRIEAAGGVDRAELELGLEAIALVHERAAAERASLIEDGHEGPTSNGGVGGTRVGVKCLHAHLAAWLAGSGDTVGLWAAEELVRSECELPVVYGPDGSAILWPNLGQDVPDRSGLRPEVDNGVVRT